MRQPAMRDDDDRNPVEALAEQFLASYRRGEHPSVTEYVRRHPELSDEILEVFPAMLMMEEARPQLAGRHGDGPQRRAEGGADGLSGSLGTDDSPIRVGKRSTGRAQGEAAFPIQLGDFRIIREIARGGMGVVYEAIQESLGRKVAVKMLPPEWSADASCLKRFRREARAAARLHHTNIVPVFEVAETDGATYYAMQFIRGRGLDEVIVELRRQLDHSPHESRRQPIDSAAPTDDADAEDHLSAQLASALIAGRFPDPAAIGEQQSESPTAARPGSSSAEHTRRMLASDQSASLDDISSTTPQSRSPGSGSVSSGLFRSGNAYYRSIAKIGLQVAEALAYAHAQRLLHRDIKPSNLLLDLNGTLWVTDFGLVRDEDELLTRTGDIVGTLRYLAPERFNGESDERCDIYSLGLTLYELVALRPAFGDVDRRRLVRRIAEEEPARLGKVDPRVPRDLETIIHKASAKEPSRRYANAAALAEDLRRFLSDRPIRARRASIGERMWRWCRRNVAVATLLALLMMSFFAGFAGVAWKWRDAEHSRQREQEAHRLAERRAEEIQRGLDQFKLASGLFERGRWYIGEERWDDAYIALHQAVNARPDFTAIWIERGELLARLGLFDLAADDFAQAFRLNASDNVTRWYWHALLQFHSGDVANYRRICAELERRFGGTLHIGMAVDICRIAMLDPASSATAEKHDALQARITAYAPDTWTYAFVAGLVKLRQNQFAEAVHWLEHAGKCQPDIEASQISLPALAIAYAKFGQKPEAEAALARSCEWHDRWLTARLQPHDAVSRNTLGATTQWPISWPDWIEFQAYLREAKSLIAGAAPSDDMRQALLRARAFGGLRWHIRSAIEYARALAKAPSDRMLRWEACRSWGYSAAVVRLWTPAAIAFTQAHRMKPDDSDVGLLRGACHFASGNVSEYRKACAESLRSVADTQRARTARNVSTMFLCADGAVDNPDDVIKLAERMLPQYHDGHVHLAGVLCRAGRYEQAIETFNASPAVYSPRAGDWALIAMAHWRVGRADEAEQYLAKAERWVREANANHLNDPSDSRPGWGGLDERIIAPLLVREAQQLIQRQPARATAPINARE